jgi:hypothetical protein
MVRMDNEINERERDEVVMMTVVVKERDVVPRDTDVGNPVDDIAENEEGTKGEEVGLTPREGSLVGHEEEVEDVGDEEDEDDSGAPPHEGVAKEVDNLARVVHVLGPVQHAPDVQRPGVPK